MESVDIAVLGGGPAGLSAAVGAAERGREVVLLERADHVGGMAASFEVAGVRVDHGSHRLHPSIDPRILERLDGLLGDDLQTRERNGRIRLHDRWVAFPLRTGDMLENLPRSFALRAARDALTAPFRRPREDTFAEVVRAGLGPTVADAFYRPYVEKLWDTPPEALSGELARRRVSARSPLDVVRRLVRGARPEGRTFLYPRRGFGQISEALADAVVAAGADVRLDHEVVGLETTEHATVIRGEQSAVEARQVWSTLPLPLLARISHPGPPPDALAAAGRLRHRAMLLVYLVVDRPHYTPFDAHYFPARELPVARLSEPKNYRESADDPTERTVVCAEVPCWQDDDLWNASDRALGELVADSLTRAGLPEVTPHTVEVRRLPRVYPVYAPGFEHDLADLERWAAGWPGLITFGRQGLFAPDNTHHALAMGWAAADALREDGFDDETWARARDGFRAHVVED